MTNLADCTYIWPLGGDIVFWVINIVLLSLALSFSLRFNGLAEIM